MVQFNRLEGAVRRVCVCVCMYVQCAVLCVLHPMPPGVNVITSSLLGVYSVTLPSLDACCGDA